jgi:HEAT repeat protein
MSVAARLLPGATAPGPNERLLALRELPEGPGSVAALLAATDDPSPDIARVALRLGKSGAVGAAEPLRSRMLDVDPGLTADFARALAALGDEEAAGRAAGALVAGRPHRRIAAATALEVLAGEEEVPALLGALRDPLAAVRLRSLRTLARIGASVDAPACAVLLDDPDAAVRAAAVETVAALGPRPHRRLLMLVDDPAPAVRQALARRPALLDRRSSETLLADRQPTVRRTAVEAAGPADAPALERMLGEDRVVEVRIAAARRLAEIGRETGAEALIAALADPGLMMRAAVERALREAVGRSAAISRLLDALADADPVLRRNIVYALAHLDAVEAGPAFLALAQDPDREVRLAVVHCGARLFGATWSRLADLETDPDPAVAYGAALARAEPFHQPEEERDAEGL